MRSLFRDRRLFFSFPWRICVQFRQLGLSSAAFQASGQGEASPVGTHCARIWPGWIVSQGTILGREGSCGFKPLSLIVGGFA